MTDAHSQRSGGSARQPYELFDGAGHFPHIDGPRRFADVLHEVVTSTQPARTDQRSLRRHLQETR